MIYAGWVSSHSFIPCRPSTEKITKLSDLVATLLDRHSKEGGHRKYCKTQPNKANTIIHLPLGDSA